MILEKESKINSSPKDFWKIINPKTKNNFPDQFYLNDIKCSNDNDISNLFATHFKSVYDNKKLQPYIIDNIKIMNKLNKIEITISDVEYAIKNTNLNSPAGPDCIFPIIVKMCCSELVLPLHLLFNKIIKSCKYPDNWKVSYIIPCYKAGDKHDITNYRLISIINVFSKLFEKILFIKVSNYLYQYIVCQQHGGIPGLSTSSNLAVFSEFIMKVINQKSRVQVIYLDMVKAFDKVNHELLIDKLHQYGIEGELLQLITNYLSNRHQIVKFNNTLSEKIEATSGVPQGSNLVSLFYIIYVNDIANIIKNSSFLLYIDDLKIYKELKTQNCSKDMQYDIDNLYEWALMNNLKFNHQKTFTMLYTRITTQFKSEFN